MFKTLGIRWSYEPPVFVWGENKKPRVWVPDFFLVTFGSYIEVCGSKNFDYDYTKTMNIMSYFYIYIRHRISGRIIFYIISRYLQDIKIANSMK